MSYSFLKEDWFIFNNVYMYVCGCYLYVCMDAGDHQKRASDPAELELMMFVTLLPWVLGTERAVHAL